METTLENLTTGNPALDHLIALVGIFTTISSAVASFLNAKIRSALDAGNETADIPALFLYAGLLANYCAFNIDKAAQIHKMLRGHAVTVVKVANAPAPQEPKP